MTITIMSSGLRWGLPNSGLVGRQDAGQPQLKEEEEEEDEMAELRYKKYHLPSAEGRVSPSGGASSREGKL